ncbi:MAG: hypothetical protein LC731_01615, partial [Acidobacteria bacterium]|nr:hypothetical protein [Acidobacteriota bacterium]
REWQQQHITNIDPSRVRHDDLKRYLERLRAEGIKVNEVGRSLAGRSIYQMEFGRGPLKVFMWSQMHGDEPTATSALVDLFYYLQRNRRVGWVAAIEKSITLRAVPMLNPDGTELYQRRNLQFIDINRDARTLSTPEGRLLKKLRDEWAPDIGFNLHNQGARTAVGESGLQATISLLAVPSNADVSDSPGRIRNKKLCAIIVEALSPFIYGHIGRYDDTFNPRAFGDMIGQWGTPVILIETGALRGKSEMDLVQLNFIAYAAALSALADGSVEEANPAVYDALRANTGDTIFNLIVRHATVINRLEAGMVRVPPFITDIAVNQEVSRGGVKQETRWVIQDVGDLSIFYGLEEVDASGYYVTAAGGVLRPGADAALLFYKKERASQINWTVPDLETRFPPDAVYRNGHWSGSSKMVIK